MPYLWVLPSPPKQPRGLHAEVAHLKPRTTNGPGIQNHTLNHGYPCPVTIVTTVTIVTIVTTVTMITIENIVTMVTIVTRGG